MARVSLRVQVEFVDVGEFGIMLVLHWPTGKTTIQLWTPLDQHMMATEGDSE